MIFVVYWEQFICIVTSIMGFDRKIHRKIVKAASEKYCSVLALHVIDHCRNEKLLSFRAAYFKKYMAVSKFICMR